MAAGLKIRTRETGATATMPKGALPVIATPTGGQLDLVTGVEAAGFNPLDLLYASLAACIALSLKGAATKLGLSERMGEVQVAVRGQKAADGPSRVEAIEAVCTIDGDLSGTEREALLHLAEELCTVSNTLKGGPAITARLA